MMSPAPRFLISIAWIAILIVWLIGATNSKPTVRKQSLSSRVLQSALFGSSFVLLFNMLYNRRLRLGPLAVRFLPDSGTAAYAGLILTIAGVAFAIWARLRLGRNWSGTVTLKQNHQLIRTGPYALVRHPIYTGLLLAMLGTAVEIGKFGGLLAVAVAFIGLQWKVRDEEAFMTEQFGAEYLRYKSEVKALIPGIV